MMQQYLEMRKPASRDEIGLYCHVGEAISAVQHLEDALSHSITLKKDVGYPKRMSKTEADQSLEKYRSYTLGQAIKLARQKCLYSESMQQELEAFVKERNWLVHKSIAHNRDDWDLGLFKNDLLLRIKTIVSTARKIQLLIEEDLICFSDAKGVDMSGVRAEIEKYYAKSSSD